MKRILLSIAAVALAASTAIALEVKEDDAPQAKPPREQRVDHASPGLSDYLTSAPTTESEATAAGESAECASAQHGAWRPPLTE